MKKDKLLNYVLKKSKQNPLDIFELNDGRIIVINPRVINRY